MSSPTCGTTLAAAQGDDDARHSRDRIASDMSRAEVLQARRLARDWKPSG